MAKRRRQGKESKGKRQKLSGFIDPGTSGIYATCNRGKENGCRNELMNLFGEKIQEYYSFDEINKDDSSSENAANAEMSIEDKIKLELAEMKETKANKQDILKPIDLGCECIVFIKTRKPVQPASFIEKLCNECETSGIKSTRYTQKLTPVTYSVSPTEAEIRKLAAIVLGPHFHKEEGQKPHKFAIQVTRRNFNTIEKDSIIKLVAECVGKDHGHSVDLKKYDKLIIVECFKSNVGMSVVNNYLKLEKFNLQQIFDKTVEKEEK